MLGITGQGRALGIFLVAGNASVLCAKLEWLRAMGRQPLVQRNASTFLSSSRGSPPPMASLCAKEAAEEDIVQAGSELGLRMHVGRGINTDGVTLPGS